MVCPVCGDGEAVDVCGRCGTDLRALDGRTGEPRLEVVPVRPLGGTARARRA